MKYTRISPVLGLALSSLQFSLVQSQASEPDAVEPKKQDQKYLRRMDSAIGNNHRVLQDEEIIGGFEQQTALPWFVQQLACNDQDCSTCGATLVHSDIVLTAAHCLDGYGVPTEAILGALNVDFSTCFTTHDGTQIFPVDTSLLIHPNYDANNIGNGYALAMYKISHGSTNPAISLNTNAAVPADGETLFTFGYGRTSAGGEASTRLKGLQTSAVVPCEAGTSDAPDQHVCILPPSGSGTCQGDSGGPVVTSTVASDVNSATLLGVNSYGINECAAGFNDVFVDVSYFQSWIQSYICSNSASPPSNCRTTRTSSTAPAPDTTSNSAVSGFLNGIVKNVKGRLGFGV